MSQPVHRWTAGGRGPLTAGPEPAVRAKLARIAPPTQPLNPTLTLKAL